MAVIKSAGTYLDVDFSDSTSSNWVTIAQGVSYSGPGASRSGIDATHLQSDVITSVPGLSDPGELSGETMWDVDNATHVAIKAAYDAGDILPFKLRLSSGTAKVGSFSGYFNEWAPEIGGHDEKVRMTFKVKLTTKVTQAAS